MDEAGEGGSGEVAVEAVVDGQVQETLPVRLLHLRLASTPPPPADAGIETLTSVFWGGGRGKELRPAGAGARRLLRLNFWQKLV